MTTVSLPTLLLLCCVCLGSVRQGKDAFRGSSADLKKRWLFVWGNLADPREVDRMLERFPRAAAAGYNGVVFPANIPADQATATRQAAESNHLDLIAIVMHGVKDRNYVEGVPA